MPNQIIQIFNQNIEPGNLYLSDGFTNVSFFYLNTNDGFELDIDISLQIYLTPFIQRSIRLENDNVLNTISVTKLPSEFVKSPHNMRLEFNPSTPLYLEAYAVRTECCGERELSQIKSQLNRIEMQMTLVNMQLAANNVLTGFLDFLIGGALTVIIPALAPGAIFSLLNPATASAIARIFFDAVPQFDLLPGQHFISDGNFLGQVAAQTLDGTDSTLQYRVL